jgi:hypothetical protein
MRKRTSGTGSSGFKRRERRLSCPPRSPCTARWPGHNSQLKLLTFDKDAQQESNLRRAAATRLIARVVETRYSGTEALTARAIARQRTEFSERVKPASNSTRRSGFGRRIGAASASRAGRSRRGCRLRALAPAVFGVTMGSHPCNRNMVLQEQRRRAETMRPDEQRFRRSVIAGLAPGPLSARSRRRRCHRTQCSAAGSMDCEQLPHARLHSAQRARVLRLPTGTTTKRVPAATTAFFPAWR